MTFSCLDTRLLFITRLMPTVHCLYEIGTEYLKNLMEYGMYGNHQNPDILDARL